MNEKPAEKINEREMMRDEEKPFEMRDDSQKSLVYV